MSEYFIGLGSNLGEREANTDCAVKALMQSMTLLKISSLYESEPMYLKDQPWFVNCAAKFESSLNSRQMLERLEEIEVALGRERAVRYGPRTIDLDILFHDSEILEETDLKIPHPKIQERRFVLEPLVEIEPGFVHPVLGVTVATLLKNLRSSQVVRRLRDKDLEV